MAVKKKVTVPKGPKAPAKRQPAKSMFDEADKAQKAEQLIEEVNLTPTETARRSARRGRKLPVDHPDAPRGPSNVTVPINQFESNLIQKLADDYGISRPEVLRACLLYCNATGKMFID